MKREIVQYPDPVLRKVAEPVEVIDDGVLELVRDLLDSLPEHGVGLAAPQIGVSRRVAIIKLSDDDEPLVLINPEVVRRKGLRVVREGCLSFEGHEHMDVPRAKIVRMRSMGLDGKEHQIRARGDLMAQALEHEMEHLFGVLYIDGAEALINAKSGN